MFRNTLTLSLLITAAFLVGIIPARAQLKVGTVDMNRVFSEYYKTKDAQNELASARDAGKKELDDKLTGLKQSMKDIETLSQEAEKPELSKQSKDEKIKQRNEKLSEARNLDKSIAEYRDSKERQLQEQFMRKRKEIIDDIMKVVNEKVKSQGYDLVFDRSGLSLGQVPMALYSRDDMDFSQQVIDALNKNTPKLRSSGR